MIIIIAEAIASRTARRVDSRRASHAPASVDAEINITATHAPAPGEYPVSSTGCVACVQYAGSIFSAPYQADSGRPRMEFGGLRSPPEVPSIFYHPSGPDISRATSLNPGDVV
jgi:hypothetical protein